MKIENIPVSDLNPDPANVRLHPEKNLAVLKSSLAKFGQQKPIVINSENVIIAGNGTFMAACSLGWETIQCVRSELDSTNQIAFAIADNRTSELAEWDKPALGKQLEALQLEDIELEEIGFEDFKFEDDKKELTEDEIKDLEAQVELSDEIEVDKEFLVIIFDDKKSFSEFNDKIQNDFKVGYWLSRHKKNPRFFRNGPNRILRGEDFLARIKQ